MANPQLENGHIKIANEIWEALIKTRISGEARQVLDFVLRKTYGFNKKEDKISLSQLVLATGLRRPDIIRARNKLLQMNIIISKKANDNITSYRFNKDFDMWKPLAKKQRGVAKKQMVVSKKANASLAKKQHTKDNDTKDTITKDKLQDGHLANPLHKEIVEVIDAFKEINQSYKQFYGNKTQRAAAERLFKEYGSVEEIKKRIEIIKESNKKPFAPVITTPKQFEDKRAALKAFFAKEDNK